jgi:hypothetical protein
MFPKLGRTLQGQKSCSVGNLKSALRRGYRGRWRGIWRIASGLGILEVSNFNGTKLKDEKVIMSLKNRIAPGERLQSLKRAIEQKGFVRIIEGMLKYH